MKTKILNILLITFSLLFIILPIMIIFYHNLFIGLFLLVIFLVTFYFLFLEKRFIISDKYKCIFVFLLTFITRLLFVIIANKYIIQVSNFEDAFSNAMTLSFDGIFYRVFTHWIIFPEIVHYLFLIFGNHQLVALIFNTLIVSINASLIYLISNQIFKNTNISLLSSLIYVLWPSMLLYVAIFTPDHLASLLLLLSIYLILRFFNNSWKKSFKYKILFATLIGAVLGLSVFFKNFAPVILVSLSIYLLLCFLYKDKIKTTIIKYLYLIIIIISFSITKSLMFLHVEDLVGNSVVRNVAPCYLNVGLNSKGTGHYDKPLYNMYYETYKETNYNYQKTNKIIMTDLKKDIKSNYKNIDNLLFLKAFTIISNDNAKILWVIDSLNTEKGVEIINNTLIINQIYYIIITIAMLVSLLINVKKKNIELFYIYIIIFGSLLMLLLVEAQGRYIYAIQPLFCICAAYCFLNSIKATNRDLILDKMQKTNKS